MREKNQQSPRAGWAYFSARQVAELDWIGILKLPGEVCDASCQDDGLRTANRAGTPGSVEAQAH